MDKKHIVIIGSGFGGIYTAKHLKPLLRSEEIEVTIINKTNYFLFTPLLHEVATGGLYPTSVVESIRETFRRGNIHFVQDTATAINPATNEVTTSKATFKYDYLVVSSGAETNYYGIKGARENSRTLKNLDDALEIRRHIISTCEKASHVTDPEERKKMLSCAIVGAGATGVELATELVEFMHETLCSYYKMCGLTKEQMPISLVAASADVLPMFPPELRTIAQKEMGRKGIQVMTSMKVVEVQPGKIIFDDGKTLDAHTVIWVAGIKPTMLDIAGSDKEKNGRIKIDEFLKAVSTDNSFNNIFALGDASGTHPQLAQVAKQQGKAAALNIIASIDGKKLKPFVYHEKGLLVSLGQWYAAGNIFGVTLKGPVMWWIWRTVYLFNFQSWDKRIKIAGEWTLGLFSPRDISQF